MVVDCYQSFGANGCGKSISRRACKFYLFILIICIQIDWENRKTSANESDNIKVTVDGTDCRVYEPAPFDPKWYSHKFKGPGLRYEIGICIANGHIVWVNGPYPCGAWPDIKIAKHIVYDLFDPNEKAIADAGYKDGERRFITPTGTHNSISRLHSLARARHETCNRRLKQFRAIGDKFRHNINKHGVCFHAVANVTQLMIENGQPLFDVPYSESMI